MKAQSFLKLGLVVASVILLAACSKKMPGSADMADGEASSQGLGQFTRFAGQQPGESYTTQAPHNQLYLFAYDDSSFAPKYRASLDAQSDYLIAHPGARVLLAGHTDERGSREYNIALGERRANTVAQLMRMAGVNRTQIRVVSYGKERPINLGHDEASHLQNRRVELTYEATR
ncbi:peptidoglycan-associated lipoprotein Pal [Legionella spiritensis]|uniref:Peptidoglycan-associated lipoprotein n=1 Tax=Legionella spiritensis TaxID=452 RepID=A0A0W0Z5J8_LEGSP|nr:peptidoglycan-associated lipoprotein Pal [Legionella spiritensis]KTD64411.1 Peptidoglycan-associated lipoprotein precursor (19 kDa surface antigen) (PPL) [Legionella spiritensis]SNV46034.1 Peptidoglycan-associated lipoprotein precursor (19 kDa surface antigen) (PPL) [Legionella spiritensis]VEG91024.1 Peptidoglycan-associated lipoprotein precursor (19 kDa surface antigen) (PPL) [Legionella spiritensis]